MRTLTVNLSSATSSYPVVVGSGILPQLGSIIDSSRFSSIVIVADAALPNALIHAVSATFAVKEGQVLRVQGGESIKEFSGLQLLWEFFASQKLDRASAVINLGGGSITDLGGFAASTYMRGIPFINIPTTLLAQVDASVGGKTGINFSGVKNLLGSITQPAAVVIDIDTLATLSPREKRSGFAEMIKHGAIADKGYFDLITSRSYDSWSSNELADLIFQSCCIKQKVVELDPKETGLRKILNFGHTIGHGVESLLLHAPAPLTHGEAVAIGMCGEAALSVLSGRIPQATADALFSSILRSGLPVRIPAAVSTDTLRQLISRDKKNSGSVVKWSLLSEIGEAVFDIVVEELLIQKALATIQSPSPI
jgi:3-dehydroquinate synthase